MALLGWVIMYQKNNSPKGMNAKATTPIIPVSTMKMLMVKAAIMAATGKKIFLLV
jgi:hypothetical protein